MLSQDVLKFREELTAWCSVLTLEGAVPLQAWAELVKHSFVMSAALNLLILYLKVSKEQSVRCLAEIGHPA